MAYLERSSEIDRELYSEPEDEVSDFYDDDTDEDPNYNPSLDGADSEADPRELEEAEVEEIMDGEEAVQHRWPTPAPLTPAPVTHTDNIWLVPTEQAPPRLFPSFTGPRQGYRDGSIDDPSVICNPADCFLVYFKPIIDLLVVETNRYYNEYVEANPDKFSNKPPCPPVTLDEMLKFLSLSIHMGHVFINQLQDYWSTSELFKCEFWGKVMSRDRFKHILRFLHFEDNRNAPDDQSRNTDRLWRLRRVSNMLREIFSKFYAPSQELAIDEVICAYKGRLLFRQYIPSKRKRFGIKVYKICDNRGYTLDFLVYTGKRDNLPNVTQRTVTELCTKFEGHNHILYMDNFFSSPALFNELKEKKILCCGTARSNRQEMPIDFQKKNRKSLGMVKGELAVRVNENGLVCALFFDKRFVLMLSSAHEAPEPGLYSFETQPGRSQLVKPPIIQDYNSNMGFVDKSDQMLSTNNLHRRTNKWTKKLFFHFLDTAVLNAFILNNCSGVVTRKMNLHDFRLKLVKDLILMCNTATARPSPRLTSKVITRLEVKHSKHWPKKGSTRRRCIVCQKSGVEKRTNIFCLACNVGLCLEPCFEVYHTKVNY